MNTLTLTRVSGILLIFVFAINMYLGIDDSNLKMVMVHYDINWVIAAASLVGAVFLLLKPKSMIFVLLGGIIWPILYAISLGVDVETKMCLGAPSTYCEPSHTAAFDYLVLNNANINIPSSYSWVAAPVIPIAILLLAVVFILSLISLNSMRSKKVKVAPAVGPTTPKSSMPNKTDDMKGK
ncbi:MAG: hypothetical protein ACHQ03_12180 [Candidatus Bathyarchaeia archaeon]